MARWKSWYFGWLITNRSSVRVRPSQQPLSIVEVETKASPCERLLLLYENQVVRTVTNNLNNFYAKKHIDIVALNI